ncbi:Attractin-like protein 1 [Varanus komodoensis]|nr:Attractin-like protein 1 [Varanus komodoensis]
MVGPKDWQMEHHLPGELTHKARMKAREHRSFLFLFGGSMLLSAICVEECCEALFILPLLQKISPWVGLRKINISYWGWDDMSPFTNTTLQWLPGEPNDSGFCAYLERAEVAGLKANPCTAMADGLAKVIPQGNQGSIHSEPGPKAQLEWIKMVLFLDLFSHKQLKHLPRKETTPFFKEAFTGSWLFSH